MIIHLVKNFFFFLIARKQKQQQKKNRNKSIYLAPLLKIIINPASFIILFLFFKSTIYLYYIFYQL